MTISILHGSITDTDCAVIVNASNGRGIMGSGTAGAISRAGGPSIQEEAKTFCKTYNPCPGMVFRTNGGNLNCVVFHAITMTELGTSYRNNVEFGLGIVRKCSDNIFRSFKVLDNQPYAESLKETFHSIAVPGLGTGIGGLPSLAVARIMVKSAIDHGFRTSKQQVIFTDIDNQFLLHCKKAYMEIIANEY